jgi:cytochrome P450
MKKDAYHSLSGPKSLPVLGNIHQITVSKLHQDLEAWAKEFGLIYKLQLGPSKLIVITDPKIIQEVLRARPNTFRRMEKMDNIMQAEGVYGVFNAEGEEWGIHRKLVAQGLDIKHQQQYFPAILKSTERLFTKWNKLAKSNTSFDVQKDLMRFTVDVTTSLAFGYEMNTIEKGEDVIQNHLEKIFPVIFQRINAPIPFWKIYKTKKDKEFDKALIEINKLIDEFIAKGKEKLIQNPILKEQSSNLLEAILVAAEEDKKIDNIAIRGNLLTILMAGEDTTAHTVAWMIYYLSIYPEYQEKIREEVEGLLNGNIIADYNALGNLKFLEAFTNETMRMKPVAPLLLFEPLEDVEVKGYAFKKGRRLLVESRYATMLDENFTNAGEFKPERWLKENRCPYSEHNIKAFIPFGSGPRFCPGKNLAILEIKMIIAMLVGNFEVELSTPSKEIEEVMAFTMMASVFDIKLTTN